MQQDSDRTQNAKEFFEGKAIISGRVTLAPSHRPVSAAVVAANLALVDKKKGWPPCAKAEARSTTDNDGRYTLEIDGLRKLGTDAPQVYFSVEVMAARCVPERKFPAWRQSAFPFAGKRRRLNVELKPAYALAGRVLDEEGHPLPDTKVYIYQSSSHGCFNPSLVGGEWPVTDTDGRFFADGMPLGLPSEQRQVAGFFHPDFERRFVQRLVNLPRDGEGVAHIEVTLRKGFGISGRVVDMKGSPVSNAKVLVMASIPMKGTLAVPARRPDGTSERTGRAGMPHTVCHPCTTA
ncbi:MAG: hypothetical protein HY343_09545 [Lentisphaerae bacterium]|nr:hypothetical protein [Lentisphaerota bacterium]